MCEYCGMSCMKRVGHVNYSKKHGMHMFCSKKCSYAWYSKNLVGCKNPRYLGVLVIKCDCCGKDFEMRRADYDSKLKEGQKRFFCSRLCFYKWLSINIRGESSPVWKGGKIECTCKQCGNKFLKERACVFQQINRGQTDFFCSKKCFADHRFKGLVSCKCDQCGKDVVRRKARLIYDHVFCSRKCIIKWYRGANHANWLNGASFEPYGIEFNADLRSLIRDRDHHRCKECSIFEKKLKYKLDVHHIDYNKKNNDPNNLVSLCKSCHSQTNFNRGDWQKYYSNMLRGK